MKKTHEVFGISTEILPDSYVDRGNLDERINRTLERDTHLALRGESKCGKTWLRKKNIPDSIVVQCLYGKTVYDIYKDALGQLDVGLVVQTHTGQSLNGHVEGTGETGNGLIAKVKMKFGFSESSHTDQTVQNLRQDVTNLSFVAEILKESGKRLVIEDFHYLPKEERKRFSYDLKAFWDCGLYVVIIGVWTKSNLLPYLNPDITGRIREESIYWSEKELGQVLDKGSEALNIYFSSSVKSELISNCFWNVGILQRLALQTLDEIPIYDGQEGVFSVTDPSLVESAAITYSGELEPLYQQFADNVSSGIKATKDSTGIYAHTLAILLEEVDDQSLLEGVSVNFIFERAHEREPRIQKQNLKRILKKFERLQVDEAGRGLVLSYNEGTEEVTAVDRQLLLYRKFSTAKWPWEDLLSEAKESGDDFQVLEEM